MGSGLGGEAPINYSLSNPELEYIITQKGTKKPAEHGPTGFSFSRCCSESLS